MTTAPLRILVDVRPRLLADAIAAAVNRAGVTVELRSEELEVVHDDHDYDLVVIDDAVRAAVPARVTTRVHPGAQDALELLLDLVEVLRSRLSAADPAATPTDAPGQPPQAVS